jgi:hypothetical protein
MNGRPIMPATLTTVPRIARPLAVLAVAGGVLAAVGGLLWAYYGTAVFFEMMRAGWAACF